MRRHLGKPDRDLHRLHLAEERPQPLRLRVAPVLEQAPGLGGDPPVERVRLSAPAIDLGPHLGNGGLRRCLVGEIEGVQEVGPTLRSLAGHGVDELGAAAAGGDSAGGMAAPTCRRRARPGTPPGRRAPAPPASPRRPAPATPAPSRSRRRPGPAALSRARWRAPWASPWRSGSSASNRRLTMSCRHPMYRRTRNRRRSRAPTVPRRRTPARGGPPGPVTPSARRRSASPIAGGTSRARARLAGARPASSPPRPCPTAPRRRWRRRRRRRRPSSERRGWW